MALIMKSRVRVKKVARVAAVLGFAVTTCTVLWICLLSYRDYGIWSIGIYGGSFPYDIEPISECSVLSASDVTDVRAKGVADPFMILAKNGMWYMFFEVISNQGDIGFASSADCISWKYEGLVLDEPFHLSYPYVFEYENEYYMIPETSESNEVRLYKATEFPRKWIFQQKLLDGSYVDPSILRHADVFYLFSSQGGKLTLHVASELTGPWISHPASPIVKSNKRISRQAGRLVEVDGRLVRYAQDCTESYGKQVIAIEIQRLSGFDYSEQEMDENPILTASGYGWNKDGMHHVDLHQTDGHWRACVDGKYYTQRFDLGYGYRKAKQLAKEVLMGNPSD